MLYWCFMSIVIKYFYVIKHLCIQGQEEPLGDNWLFWDFAVTKTKHFFLLNQLLHILRNKTGINSFLKPYRVARKDARGLTCYTFSKSPVLAAKHAKLLATFGWKQNGLFDHDNPDLLWVTDSFRAAYSSFLKYIL